MNLHNDIMNLRCVTPTGFGYNEKAAYKEGHRDARHAAAELANSADMLIEEQQERISRLEDELLKTTKQLCDANKKLAGAYAELGGFGA